MLTLLFDDPDCERSLREQVPDDTPLAEQGRRLVALARRVYSETTRRPDMHRRIAEDEVLLREMVLHFGLIGSSPEVAVKRFEESR